MKQGINRGRGHEVPRVGPLALGFLECLRCLVATNGWLLGGHSGGDDLVASFEREITLPQVDADLLYPWQEEGCEDTEDARNDSREGDLRSVLKKPRYNDASAEEPERRTPGMLPNGIQSPTNDQLRV